MQNNNQQEVQSVEKPKNPIEMFKEIPLARKAAVIGFGIVMIGVMVFILFFAGNDGSEKKPKDEKKSDGQMIVDRPTTSKQDVSTKNVYVKQAESEANLIDNATVKTIDLKPPTPPVLEKPSIETAEVIPNIPRPQPKLDKSEQYSLPNLPNARPSNENENTGPKISSTSVMAFGGGTSDKTDPKDKKQNNSEFLGFDGGAIENLTLKPSTATNVVATKVNSDLRYTLLQGKVIDAVLETSINTQMSAGVIRAVISRDVYGEQGDLILIPKGSRLVGSYSVSSSSGSGSSQSGQVATRVYAVWKRIITPSGIDVNLPDTPSTDTLGRSGIPGYLDTNLTNNLMNAFFLSVLGPYIAIKASGIGNQQTTTTTNNSSNNSGGNNSAGANTTTTGSVESQILSQGMQQFQTVAQEQFNTVYPPGVTTTFVDQGTRIDIIVQQDVIFPKQSIALNTTNLP